MRERIKKIQKAVSGIVSNWEFNTAHARDLLCGVVEARVTEKDVVLAWLNVFRPDKGFRRLCAY